MLGVSVVRDDGVRGTVISAETPGRVVVEFHDGSKLGVGTDSLTLQQDGTYRLLRKAVEPGNGIEEREEVVIPVIAEELTVEKYQIARSKVRVHKRIETREEVVEVPVIREEIVVERLPVGKFVDSAPPETRDENDVLIIPVIEEVLVVEKRLFLREEVRVFKRRTTTNSLQTVTLRREIVDVEREDLSAAKPPGTESENG